MLAVRAVFDGSQIRLLEKAPIDHPRKAIVTFLDEEPDSDELDNILVKIRTLAEKGGSFDFLNDPEEDIYSDDDLAVKYR